MFNLLINVDEYVISFVSSGADARSSAQMLEVEGEEFGESSVTGGRKMQQVAVNLENTDSYISSPFSLPPFDSLSPLPSPETAPPFCVCPPFSPQPPSIPTTPPIFQGPPTHSPVPNPPEYELPSPPKHAPSSPKRAPSPPIFKPPVVLPPPSTPPPLHKAPQYAVWCVAKPTVPDPIIQEAMDYACGKGADCEAIKPDGLCFQPNTLFAHASYAFNSYWQRTKVAGGTCDFGGTAMLVTVNPSKFNYCLHLMSTSLKPQQFHSMLMIFLGRHDS